MKPVIRIAVVCLVALSSLLVAGRAEAHTTFCEGIGTLTTGSGLSYPPGPLANTTVTMHLSTGACVGGGSLSLVGTLTGWCAHWTGSGTMSDGVHTVGVSYVLNGGKMTVTAGVTIVSTTTVLGTTVTVRSGGGYGEFEVTPVPVVTGTTVTNSCSNGTARNFLVSGWMSLI